MVGRNPAPLGRWLIPVFIGLYPIQSQLVPVTWILPVTSVKHRLSLLKNGRQLSQLEVLKFPTLEPKLRRPRLAFRGSCPLGAPFFSEPHGDHTPPATETRGPRVGRRGSQASLELRVQEEFYGLDLRIGGARGQARGQAEAGGRRSFVGLNTLRCGGSGREGLVC